MVRSAALLVAALVLCAGCLAADSPGAPATEGTGTTTATSATTTAATPSTATATTATETPSYADCPYLLSVEVAGEDAETRDGAVVAYADLAEPRRAEFDRALDGRAIELGQEPNG